MVVIISTSYNPSQPAQEESFNYRVHIKTRSQKDAKTSGYFVHLKGLILTHMLVVWEEIQWDKFISSGLAAKSVDLDVSKDVNVAASNASVI